MSSIHWAVPDVYNDMMIFTTTYDFDDDVQLSSGIYSFQLLTVSIIRRVTSNAGCWNLIYLYLLCECMISLRNIETKTKK